MRISRKAPTPVESIYHSSTVRIDAHKVLALLLLHHCLKQPSYAVLHLLLLILLSAIPASLCCVFGGYVKEETQVRPWKSYFGFSTPFEAHAGVLFGSRVHAAAVVVTIYDDRCTSFEVGLYRRSAMHAEKTLSACS
jgi:hypothetical protein